MNCVGRAVGWAVGAWGLAVGACGAWPWRVGLGLAVGPAAIGCDFTAKEISWQAMGPHHRR
jgi:hypothetical protein